MAKSDDLAAELAADLEQDLTTDGPPVASPGHAARDSQPTLEAALFLAPSTWQRPCLVRKGRSLTIAAGPVRVRIGRTRV